MTTKTAKPRQPMAEASTRKRDPKFKVIPNLSLKGKDIMNRLKNNSLQLQHSGQYSLEEEIDNSRRLSKVEIMHKAKENLENINNLTSKLNKPPKNG